MSENYVTGYPPPPYYYMEYDEVNLQGKFKLKEQSKEEKNVLHEKSGSDSDGGKETETETEEEREKKEKKLRMESPNFILENILSGNINEETGKSEGKDEKKKEEPFVDTLNEYYGLYNINEMKNEENITSKIKEMAIEHKKHNHIVMFGRPPPLVIKNKYTAFGVNYDIERKIPSLDPDDLLYDEKKNLKEEFIKLYINYKDGFFELLDDIANNRKNERSKMKHLIKIHTNLFHILARLRYHQTTENIINVLKVQLKRRQIAIDKIKISLLNVYQYINNVEKKFAQEQNVKKEKKVCKNTYRGVKQIEN